MKITHDGIPAALELIIDQNKGIQQSLDMLTKNLSPPLKAEDLIGIEEACGVLGLAKSTVYAMTQAHRIPFYQPGKKLMFKRSELISWMEQCRHASACPTQESILVSIQSGIRHKPANAYKP